MKVFIKRKNGSIDAAADYNVVTKECIVLKGSIVSSVIAHSERFRGAASIEKARDGVVIDGKLIKDIKFKSASTAANFVTGTSTNGLVAWKNKDGKAIKDILKEENNE